jgi:hypothetical protein
MVPFAPRVTPFMSTLNVLLAVVSPDVKYVPVFAGRVPAIVSEVNVKFQGEVALANGAAEDDTSLALSVSDVYDVSVLAK